MLDFSSRFIKTFHIFRGSLISARRYASLPIPRHLSELSTPSDMTSARQWIADFRSAVVPRDAVELTFSRSSGPGGQNVNKVNTKAMVRCNLASKWIPMWAMERLKRTSSYVASTHTLLITSTLHRTQAQNVDDCLAKLHSMILDASMAAVKNEPSEAQQKRVRGLEKVDKARRRQDKSIRSQVKKGRSKGDWQ